MTIPRNFPFPHSGQIELFDKYGSVSVLAGATGFPVDFRVPQVRKGWLTVFGHGIDDPTAFANSTFAIMINGTPWPDYESIADQLALFSDPKEIVPIPVGQNDRIQVRAVNGTGVAHLYAARIKGFWDRR